MKTELRRKRMKLGPTDMVIAESPVKFPPDLDIPSSLPMSQFMRHSSFYSEKPSRNVSKYAKLEERMTQKVLSPPSQKLDSSYVAGSWLTSPRRITPKALFGSLLSPSPSGKASTNLPRKLNLKSPVRSVGSCALLDFKSPIKTVGSSTLTATVASPSRSTSSGLPRLDLDSPSHNTRSHISSGKQGMQFETAATQQPEILASPSSLSRRSSRLLSPSRVAVTPNSKQHDDYFTSSHPSCVAKSSQVSVGKSSRSYDAPANQIPAYSPKRVTLSSCSRRSHVTKCDVIAMETCSDTCNTMKDASDNSSCFRGKRPDKATESDRLSPKKKRLSVSQSPPFTSTLCSSAKSPPLLVQPVEKAADICDSEGLVSVVGTSDPHLAQNCMSRKRKKSGEDVTCKPAARKRPHRQLHSGSHSNEQGLSTVAANVNDKQSEESALFTTLSFGCDVESHGDVRVAVVGQNEKVNSEVLWQFGSSGVESESSSNDVDLMMTRKYLLNRKCSSGFQSLGHISETECCPSPVFPTISSEAVVGLSGVSDQNAASNSVSASPVFGKKQMQLLAGDSPCLSLSGSGRKRTPVPGCTESFSPDVSQHSIAHLMTSPLLDGTQTLPKTGRDRSSTRRCLDQQMYQSGKRLSVSRHSSSKLTDEDN